VPEGQGVHNVHTLIWLCGRSVDTVEMLAEYATASLKAGKPLLQRTPRLKGPALIRCRGRDHQLHRTGSASPHRPTRRINPLDEAWMPAESYRAVGEPMKQLTMSETPPELAAVNDFIRERSLATI